MNDLLRRGTGRSPNSVDPVATRALVLVHLPADAWITLQGMCERLQLPPEAASNAGHVRAALEWLRIYGQAEMRRLGALGATERLLGVEDSGPARQFWRRLNG